jgi:methionyl-tRNA synthetase
VERMREHGDLYEDTYSGLYCTACEAFYTEADLIDGRCPEHGTPPTFTEERNTFFRLSAYADALLARYAADPPFVLPQTRLNEVRSHVEGGLQDVSITREAVNWGVPLPWDPEQAIYVWIDALINYTSALTYARPGEDLTARLWPARWQFLGKDILRFHAVIWPAMLLSAGYELPQQLFIHGMLAGQDGHRMSKTRGNAMDYRPAVEVYGPDALRYYLLREVAFGQDGGVGYAGMHERYHSDLANDLGNLVSRSIAMVTRYRGGAIPAVPSAPELVALSAEVAAAYEHRFDVLDFTGALEHVWELVRALNRFVETRAPWELAKSEEPEAVAALDETLATLCEGVRALAVLLWPFLPSKAPLMLAAVGEPADDVGFDRAVVGSGSGRAVGEAGGQLFPRIDAPPA